MRTDIGSLHGASDWGWWIALDAIATAGRFGSGYTAARSAGLDPLESRAIGVMMNIRGLMELVVLTVGLDLGVIPPGVFTMPVIMAILSNLLTTPALRLWLRAADARVRETIRRARMHRLRRQG